MAAVAGQGHDLTLPEPASTPDSVSMTIPFGVLIGLGRFAERSSPARSGDGAGASKRSFAWAIGAERGTRIVGLSGLPAAQNSGGQLYTSRQKFRTGELTGLAPVTLAPLAGQLPAAAAPVDPMWTLPVADQPAGGTIEVELPSGVKLRLTGAVDEAALHRVDRQRVAVTVALKKLSLCG